MRGAFRGLAHTIAGCVALQAAFIAYATFGLTKDKDAGTVIGKSYAGNAGWNLHAVFGNIVMPLLALALLGIAFATKISKAITWALIVAGVTIVQVALGHAGDKAPLVGALHGLLAIGLFVVALRAGTAVGREPESGPEPPAA
jgi:hypothetical protein